MIFGNFVRRTALKSRRCASNKIAKYQSIHTFFSRKNDSFSKVFRHPIFFCPYPVILSPPSLFIFLYLWNTADGSCFLTSFHVCNAQWALLMSSLCTAWIFRNHEQRCTFHWLMVSKYLNAIEIGHFVSYLKRRYVISDRYAIWFGHAGQGLAKTILVPQREGHCISWTVRIGHRAHRARGMVNCHYHWWVIQVSSGKECSLILL